MDASTTAPSRSAPFAVAVDGAEGRGGEGDEEPGSVPDGGGDVLAAEDARADEVVGVSGVEA
jgi:hypothetical protein